VHGCQKRENLLGGTEGGVEEVSEGVGGGDEGWLEFS